uniref:Uncharacterized protein n=1 Tax=Anguilla anguilla TaxID=7936 RepID=A0A0E9UL38_ANGAN
MQSDLPYPKMVGMYK